MTINFTDLLAIFPDILKAKMPVLLRGPTGCGKSEFVYQVSNMFNMEVLERRVSQWCEGDVSGLPDTLTMNNTKCTVFMPPEWLQTACSRPVVLFFDEIDRAIKEVSQALFELTDSRKIAGHKLHEDTLIVAAINGGEGNSDYMVQNMDPAEISRWTIFDVEPTVKEFLSYCVFNNLLHPLIVNFLSSRPDCAEHSKSFEPGKKYPDRRSWVRCSKTLTLAKLLDDEDIIKQNLKGRIFNITEAFIGFDVAILFVDYLKTYKYELDPRAILDDPNIVNLTESFTLSENLTLIEKADLQKLWDIPFTNEQAQNATNYFCSLPAEIGLNLFYTIGAFNANIPSELYPTRTENAIKISMLCPEYMKEIMGNKELLTAYSEKESKKKETK